MIQIPLMYLKYSVLCFPSSLVCAIKVNVLLPFRIHEIVIQPAYAFALPCISFVRFSSAKGVFHRASHSIFLTAFSLSFAVVETVHFQTVNDVGERLMT